MESREFCSEFVPDDHSLSRLELLGKGVLECFNNFRAILPEGPYRNDLFMGLEPREEIYGGKKFEELFADVDMAIDEAGLDKDLIATQNRILNSPDPTDHQLTDCGLTKHQLIHLRLILSCTSVMNRLVEKGYSFKDLVT